MITYNEQNFIKDGEAWLPVMGEYQYSCNDRSGWREGMAKMKALGIDVVASYCFWICHEEIKGKFNFRGNNNLRYFLRLAKENGLKVCLRIGPWVHAETRNGGFPDWIYTENIPNRRNDPTYMFYVKRYFQELYKQCKGYMYDENGTIFAIQVENEYSQKKRGKDIGDEHINALIDMLKEIGFTVPVYFATGWGEAAIGRAIPVWGAYPEAPWEDTEEELPPQDGYYFSSNPNVANIGSETGRKEMDLNINEAKYPYATVELGSGIQVTRKRRPLISGDDVTAIAMCKLGCGVGAIGYYIFHGGYHPIGALSTTQEYRDLSRELAGFYCDLPILDYDFQAPISRYNRITERGKTLKLVNYFIRDFGGALSEMPTEYPSCNPKRTDDLQSLRCSVRKKGDSGFVFFNNYVRHYKMAEHDICDFTVECEEEKIVLPHITLKDGDYFVVPFNLPLGNATIRTANATPLMKVNGDFVFWNKSGEALYDIRGEHTEKIITLSKHEAENSYKFVYAGKERLFITDSELYVEGNALICNFADKAVIKVYPDIDAPFEGFRKIGTEGIFGVYEKRAEPSRIRCSFIKNRETDEYTEYTVFSDCDSTALKELYLYLDYDGESIEVYLGEEIIADGFYTGRSMEIGLAGYGYPQELIVRIKPLLQTHSMYIEKTPAYINGKAQKLNKLTAEVICTVRL